MKNEPVFKEWVVAGVDITRVLIMVAWGLVVLCTIVVYW